MRVEPFQTRPEQREAFPLYSPRQLPELEGHALVLTWDQDEADSLIYHGDFLVWRERTGWEVYDRFEEMAAILKFKYGSRLLDLVPTPRSLYALYGDSTPAFFHVVSARESLAAETPQEAFHWLTLEKAIRDGEIGTLKRYLTQGGDPNLESIARNSGVTLLHEAARRRQPEIARMLIASGANVNAMNTLEKPPLADALDTYFLSRDPDLSRLTPRDPAILQPERTFEIVRLLVDAGANLSGLNRAFEEMGRLTREMYCAPLTLAARAGYLSALRFLLERGADSEVQNHFGDTPLIDSVLYGQAEAAQILIAAGANVHHLPYHPFHIADTLALTVAKSQRLDGVQKATLVQKMAEAGADINSPNQIGETPLLAAIRLGTEYRFGKIGFTDKSGVSTEEVVRLPVEPKWPQANIVPVIRALIAAGAEVHARDREGKTAREVAQEAELTELAALL